MGQSLHQVYCHIVFSTKDRRGLIDGAIEERLYSYIGGICRDLGASLIKINGMPDHIHLLVRMVKSLADDVFIQKIKGCSSRWMSSTLACDFAWQTGYGCFSVSAKDIDLAAGYIAKQKEHHKVESFQDELRRFLRQYGIKFDEAYLWR